MSNLALRYSSQTQPAPTPTSTAPRPTHRHSQSMQPVGSRSIDMSTSSSGTFIYNEFGGRESSSSAFGSPPSGFPRPSYTDRDRPYSRQSLPPPHSTATRDVYSSSPTKMGSGADEEHSSYCACDSCSRRNYGSSGGGGTEDLPSGGGGGGGGGKRISMPAFLGGKR